MRDVLYDKGFKKGHDPVAGHDVGFLEVIARHFLDLMQSNRSPLEQRSLERTAAAFTGITIINQLFLGDNDVVELGWLEREYYCANKSKWDGVLFFKAGNNRVSPGFIEFSGGSNDSTSLDKERSDIQKLYANMIKVVNGYPAHVEKKIFCLRFNENKRRFL